MTKRRDARGTLRDYSEEYKRYASSAKAKAERAARNKARRSALRKGLVHKGDSLEIDHKNSNPRDNRPSNLRVVSRHTNRSKREDSRLKGSKRAPRKRKR